MRRKYYLTPLALGIAALLVMNGLAISQETPRTEERGYHICCPPAF